jgi:hypothetical protein
LNYLTLLLEIEYVLDEMNFYQRHCRSSQWQSSLGLVAASSRGEDVDSQAVPSGQGFERAVIFLLDRLEMRFRWSCFPAPERRPRGRLKMLSLVGGG